MCNIRMIRGDKLIATTSALVMRLGRVYLSTIIISGSAPSFLNGSQWVTWPVNHN